MSELTFDFAERTVLITGGARGIGAAIGQRFAEAGAAVWLIDIDEDELRACADSMGCNWTVADIGETNAVHRIVDEAAAVTGRIDVVVNNAGILRDRMLWKLSDEDWDAVIRVHLGGMFRLTRACVPHFRQRSYGRVVNVTSYSGLRGNVGQSAYAAAKAGVIGFTKTAAKELARFGVTVNAICPNAETRMITGLPERKRAELESLIPLGRYATPSEITAAVAFLASEDANYITGTVLRVDGGIAM